MSKKRMADALSAYTERLIGRPEATSQINLAEDERERLTPLFQLAEWLQQSIPPVQLSPTFTHSLGSELVNHARRQFALRKRTRRVIIISAAAVGSFLSILSVAGAIVFLIKRWRAQTQARHATMG